MYFQFALEPFENISFFIFKYDQKFSVSILLKWNDIDFFIEIFALNQFLKYFFIIYFPENKIRIFIYQIEGIVVKIEKRLIEECFFDFFRGRNMIGCHIMMK